jgi:hypothetical protein
VRGHTAVAILGLEQRLRDDGAQRFGQHRTHHFLFRRREDVDHAVNRLGRRRGVQRAEHQVAGFGRRQRQADGFQVAHFADQDDVRVFAQRRAQGVGEGQRVRPDFALVDQALLRFMHEFDRVLDGQDVAVVVFVDVIDHRRQRRRLARTGRPGDQHDAARVLGNFLEDFRAVQLFQRQHLGRNGPEDGGGAALLVEGIDPETRQVGNLEGEVALQRFFVNLALAVVHDVVHHAVHVLVLHRRQVDAAHVAVHPDHRRQAGRQVKVGGLVLDTERPAVR